MRPTLARIAGVICFAGFGSLAAAADVSEVRAWLEQAVPEAMQDRLTGVHAKLIVTQVSGHTIEGNKVEVDLWWWDDRLWRVSEYQPVSIVNGKPGGPLRSDTALSGDVMWVMGESLSIENLSTRPPERSWENAVNGPRGRLTAARWGALRALGFIGTWTVEPGASPNQWIVKASNPSISEIVTLEWRPELRTAITLSRTHNGATVMDGPRSNHFWRWSDWKPVRLAEGEVLMAHRLETLVAENGPPSTIVELVQWSSLDEETAKGLAAIPDPTGIDPVRGQLRITAVNDYRPNVAKSTITRAGETVEVPIKLPSQDRFGWLRPVGWIAFVACVVGVIWVRLKAGASA